MDQTAQVKRLSTHACAVMLTFSFAAASCGGSSADRNDSTSVPDAVESVAVGEQNDQQAEALVEEILASFDPENLDAAVAEAAALDRAIELQMAEWSGLEEALGGPAAAEAAFASHDGFYAALAAAADAPVTLGFRRGQAEPPSIGMGLFGGFMVVGLGSKAIVTATNDGKTGTVTPTKGFTITAKDESVEMAVDTSLEDEGLTTTLKTNVKIVPCPDVNGEFTVEAVVDVSASAGGKKQTGKLEVKVKGQLNDNAELASSSSDYRLRRDGLGMGAFVDSSVSWSTDGSSATKLNDFNWFTTKPEHFTSNAQLATIFGRLIQTYLLDAVEQGYTSGRCVEIAYGVSPGTTGLQPGSTATINARPRGKQDGVPTGGNVQALLSAGEKSVDPSSTPVPVAAEFEYSAPDEPDKTGTVSLEARSKRGIGRVDINFDTKQPAAYQVVGGLDDWQTNTAVCDIMKPFVLTGMLTMNFSGGLSGTYEYSGGPFGAAGTGVYEIAFPNGTGQPGTMIGSGEGSVQGGGGQFSNTGTEQYTLTPIPPCE